MATQGLITITENGIVRFKVIAGCNGQNACGLVAYLPGAMERARESLTDDLSRADFIYEMASRFRFGCTECRHVYWVDKGMLYVSLIDDLDSLEQSYLHTSTFLHPTFNPRWKQGTAEYVYVIDLVLPNPVYTHQDERRDDND